VDRDITASSSAANISSVAAAEVLPLNPGKGVAVTVVVLDASAGEPKCEVSIMLNKGV